LVSHSNEIDRALREGSFGRLAQLLGVKVIHIAERDTQISAQPKEVGEFVNTWSVDGFYEEGVAPAEMGWGTHERRLPAKAAQHSGEGPGNQICLAQMAHKTLVRSRVPSSTIVGMVIRHGEAFTMCDHLTVWDGPTPVYRPTVHYAYCPSDAAWASFVELEGANYVYPERQRIMNDDIISGRDELGVLIMGHPYKSWWTGMTTSIEEARHVAPIKARRRSRWPPPFWVPSTGSCANLAEEFASPMIFRGERFWTWPCPTSDRPGQDRSTGIHSLIAPTGLTRGPATTSITTTLGSSQISRFPRK
jgi:homospermidine synthase